MRTEKQYMKNSESTMFGEILGKKKSFPTNTKKKQKQKKTQKELEMYQCLLANLH